MSFFNTLSVLVFTFLAFTSASHAGIFIEPSIGYRSHNLKLTEIAGLTREIKMASPVYGLRVGFRSLMGIDVNLAYDYSSGKAEVLPAKEKNDFNQSTAAVQLGVSALGALKIYLGYGILNELKLARGLTVSDIKLTGQAYQAGLQIKLFPMVLLGLQYNLNQYKTVEGTTYTSGDKVDTYFNKLDSQDYSLSVSTTF